MVKELHGGLDEFDIHSMARVLVKKFDPDNTSYTVGENIIVDGIIGQAQDAGVYRSVLSEMRKIIQEQHNP